MRFSERTRCITCFNFTSWKVVLQCWSGTRVWSITYWPLKNFRLPTARFIIAMLNAYEFDMKALNFIYDYLRNRKQRTEIDNAYSSWQNILYGVPQGWILWLLSFIIDWCHLFFIMNHEDIATHADDNIIGKNIGKNIVEVARFLEESWRVIFKWFNDNQFQANPRKRHVLLSTDKHV